MRCHKRSVFSRALSTCADGLPEAREGVGRALGAPTATAERAARAARLPGCTETAFAKKSLRVLSRCKALTRGALVLSRVENGVLGVLSTVLSLVFILAAVFALLGG